MFCLHIALHKQKQESRLEIRVQWGTDKNIHFPTTYTKLCLNNQMTDPNKKQKAFLTTELLLESRIGETC